MHKQPSSVWGAALGLLTGLAMISLAYLAEQWASLPFFPFVLFDWLTRVLPGGVITLGIDSMVRVIVALGLGPIAAVAKAIEQFLGILMWLAACTLLGIILAAWLRRRNDAGLQPGMGKQAGALAGLGLALLTVLALTGLGSLGPSQAWTLLWLAILIPGWGALLGTLLEKLGVIADSNPAPGALAEEAQAEERAPAIDRRAFLLRTAGGSIALTFVAAGLARLLAVDKARTGAGQPLGELNVQAAPPLTPQAGAASSAGGPGAPEIALPPTPAGRLMPAPGSRPEVTATSDFYRVDINLSPPVVAGDSWQLEVRGLFDRPRNLTVQDLLAMPAATQPITQSCISNPIGGDLISSAYYTGVRLRDVLQELGIQPGAKQLALQSADGFYESVELQDMQDPRVLLVYGMNGVTLPIEHGYPVRIYIPNRYGMKQPKWIIGMEAIDHQRAGYWVERGWSPEARPQVISIIDTVAKGNIENGNVPLGGIAWAGDRGIQSVEVQVDNGAWQPATLITPALGPLTWVQWRYEWPVSPGRHVFRARATDGKGALQNGQEQDTYPNGATGYHSVTASF